MPEPTIQCPHCQKTFPLTETLNQQMRVQLQRELEGPLQKREAEARQRELEIEKARQTIQEKVAAEVGVKLTAERAKVLQEAQRSAREAQETQLKDLQARNDEKDKRLKEAQDNELTLRKQKRELEEKQRELNLEMQRKLDAERKTIAEEIGKAKDEEHRLRESEQEKLIAGQLKLIDELKRKAEQGSQQSQGETLELDLEKTLREAFPQDLIEPVPKGMRGADVLQRVRLPSGRECGVIIWEAKRTKAWSNDWIAKLKEDQRAAKADLAALVSSVLPKDMKSFGDQSGVWVTEPSASLGLAAALRAQLREMALLKQSMEGRQDKQSMLYDYFMSSEFRQRVAAILEHFQSMRQDLEQEKRAYERLWAKREKQLEQIIKNTAGLSGSLEGILGAALPPLKNLELPGMGE